MGLRSSARHPCTVQNRKSIDSTSDTHTVGWKVFDIVRADSYQLNEKLLLLLLFEIGERHWAPSELEGIVDRRHVFHPSVVQSAGGSGCARDGG